jgi:addiction module HigA family antidote
MENKRKPTHPGKVFKLDVLEPIGLSISRAAQMLGISRKHLSDFVNEKVPCSVDLATRLAHSTNTSVASWLHMQTNLDVWKAEQTPKKALQAIEPIYELEVVEALG